MAVAVVADVVVAVWVRVVDVADVVVAVAVVRVVVHAMPHITTH